MVFDDEVALLCGIAGFHGDFDYGLLERMSSSIAHRGPDDMGLYFGPSVRVGLVNRRLCGRG